MEAIYVSHNETVLCANASPSSTSAFSSPTTAAKDLFVESLVLCNTSSESTTSQSFSLSTSPTYSPSVRLSGSPFRVLDGMMRHAKGRRRQRRVLELPASVARQWALSGKVAADVSGSGWVGGSTRLARGTTKLSSRTTPRIYRIGTQCDSLLTDKATGALTPTYAADEGADSSESKTSFLWPPWSSLFRFPRPSDCCESLAEAAGNERSCAQLQKRSKSRLGNRLHNKRVIMSSSSRPPMDAPASSSCLWRTAVDASSGRTYYYHVETRQTQWRKPLELASAEERKALEEKDAQQRAFFQAMEANILKGLATRQDKNDAGKDAGVNHSQRQEEDAKQELPAIPRPMGMRVRTISTMDVTVLKDLIGSLPSNSKTIKKMNASRSNRQENSMYSSAGSVASMGVRSSLLSIVEDSADADDQDESEEMHKSQAVVQDFFQSLQDDYDDGGESSSHIDKSDSSSAPSHDSHEQEQMHQSHSEFSVDSETDLVKNKYMMEQRPRHPNALSKDQASVAESSTSTTSLSISALGISDRQLSSGSMSEASGIMTEDGLSILDDEEVMALRQLATAANQMLHLADTEEESEVDKSDDDSLEGLQISSNHGPIPQPVARELSSLTDDGEKEESSPETASGATLPLPKPVSLAGGPPKLFPARPNMLRQRRNTCGTIYVSSTLSDPDKDATIMCVCAVYRTHVLQSTMEDAPVSEDHAIFNDLAVLQQRGSRVEFKNKLPSDPPSLDEVSGFYRDVFRRAKMEADCIIMSLIYVERLIKKTNGLLRPRPENWRSILFACMVLSSKVWDDMSMWNGDFSQTCPAGIRFPLQRINELEIAVLSSLEYNVKVKAGEYAKYYFLLRTMLIKSGLGGHDLGTMLPLDVEGAKRLQQVSSQYQTSKAFTHQYRSKSMGMLNASSLRIGSVTKAGLEQLVKM